MALEILKIMNNIDPACTQNLVSAKNLNILLLWSGCCPFHTFPISILNFISGNILESQQVKSTRYCKKKSTKFAAVTSWNSLPNHFKTENSFSHFKSVVQSWNGLECRCSGCR